MPYLDRARNAYFRHWSVEAPEATVLLLHGFGEHSGHYHRLAFALNSANLDVWALDHEGHGQSRGARGLFGSVASLADRATQLANIALQDAPPRPLVVIGHSLGGVAAALMVSRGQAVDALVLTGTPLSGLPADVPAAPVMSEEPFYLDALENDPLGFDPAPAEQALWAAITDSVPELERDLPKVPIPTLFINGERDVFAPPEVAYSWARRMPKAEVHVVAGGHHDIVNDCAHREVAGAMQSFIRSALGDMPVTDQPSPVLSNRTA